MGLNIKRAYEKPQKNDGIRILVDRLWPRGLSKKNAKIDIWLKDIAPSSELRKWFGHDPIKWIEFKKKYIKELKNNKTSVSELELEIKKGKVTLIYGAKDTEHNNAVVIKDFLEKI
ncbi:MAG: DUF488 domain-containing protein [Parachlamydiales bacterium]